MYSEKCRVASVGSKQDEIRLNSGCCRAGLGLVLGGRRSTKGPGRKSQQHGAPRSKALYTILGVVAGILFETHAIRLFVELRSLLL